jgi:hypothetical protein
VKSFKDWLAEGDTLYQQALREYQELEAQILDMEKKLAIKKDELNQIASVVGKQAPEPARRGQVELIDNHGVGSVPNTPATIARALTGRGLGGR